MDYYRYQNDGIANIYYILPKIAWPLKMAQRIPLHAIFHRDVRITSYFAAIDSLLSAICHSHDNRQHHRLLVLHDVDSQFVSCAKSDSIRQHDCSGINELPSE